LSEPEKQKEKFQKKVKLFTVLMDDIAKDIFNLYNIEENLSLYSQLIHNKNVNNNS